MVVHYPRTVWKNSYAEHEVTGKTYNFKKRRKKMSGARAPVWHKRFIGRSEYRTWVDPGSVLQKEQGFGYMLRGDIRIPHGRMTKVCWGNIGNLFVTCMRQVTKGNLYHLLGDYYIMYRQSAKSDL